MKTKNVLEKTKYPTPFETIITIDIETGSNGELLDIGLYDGYVFMYFSEWETLFEYLMDLPPKKYRIAAHNGFGFDYVTFISSLLTNMSRWGLTEKDITFLSSEALIIALVIQRGKRTLTFIDTLRFFPGSSLNKLAKDFLREEKDDVPDNYISRMEMYKKKHPKKYYAYLRKDCVLLHAIYTAFRKQLNDEFHMGELGLSSGSTALKCFRATMDDIIFACPKQYQHIADESLRGGYTQYIGDGLHEKHEYHNVNGYDVISMYPSIMRIIPVPTAPPLLSNNIDDYFDQNMREYLPGFYLTEFDDDISRVPFLYDVEKTEPVFSGTGILSHYDLAYLRARDIPHTVFEGVYYPFYDLPFTSFVDRLMAQRLRAKKDGETAKATALKIILNSLYGKFAQGYKREIIAITKDHDWYAREVQTRCARNQPIVQYFSNGDITLYGYETEGTSFSNRFIGAMVTSFARLKLGTVLNSLPGIYCDTDSIFTQSVLPDFLLGETAGKFEQTCQGAIMVCLGKKSYRLEETIKFKGIPKTCLSFDDIEMLRNGDTVKVAYRTPTALKTALKKGVVNPNKFEEKTRTVKRGRSLDESHSLRKNKPFWSNRHLKNFLEKYGLI